MYSLMRKRAPLNVLLLSRSILKEIKRSSLLRIRKKGKDTLRVRLHPAKLPACEKRRLKVCSAAKQQQKIKVADNIVQRC